MALETLRGRKKIYGVNCIEGTKPTVEHPIAINHEENIISVKIQNGPIKEVGVNGCQQDSLAAISHEIVEQLDRNFPCKENKIYCSLLRAALEIQEMRTKRREAAGIEGTNQEE